jgi:Domain of unknown function (DUF5658)
VQQRTSGTRPALMRGMDTALNVFAAPRTVYERPLWATGLGIVLALVLLLNLVDLCATVFLISAGFATEANPIMGGAFEGGTFAFALAKIVMVSAGVSVLFHFRQRRLATVGAFAALAVYGGVCVYHAHLLRCIAGECGGLIAAL